MFKLWLYVACSSRQNTGNQAFFPAPVFHFETWSHYAAPAIEFQDSTDPLAWAFQVTRTVEVFHPSWKTDALFVCFLNTKEGKIWPVSVTKKLVGTDTYTIYIFLQGKKNTQIRLDLKHGLNMHLPHTHTMIDKYIISRNLLTYVSLLKDQAREKWKTQSILVNGYKSDMHNLVATTKDLTKAAQATLYWSSVWRDTVHQRGGALEAEVSRQLVTDSSHSQSRNTEMKNASVPLAFALLLSWDLEQCSPVKVLSHLN